MRNKLTLKKFVIIAEGSDGKTYQLYIKKDTEDYILSLIQQLEGEIKALETPIEGVYLTNQKKESNNGE